MRHIYIISHTLLFFLLTAFGCNNEEITGKGKESLPENCEKIEIQEGCELSPERKTVGVFSHVQGVIQKIALTSEHTLYVISPEIKSKHMFNEMLAPCNLPEELRKEGLGVAFSGNLKHLNMKIYSLFILNLPTSVKSYLTQINFSPSINLIEKGNLMGYP